MTIFLIFLRPCDVTLTFNNTRVDSKSIFFISVLNVEQFSKLKKTERQQLCYGEAFKAQILAFPF